MMFATRRTFFFDFITGKKNSVNIWGNGYLVVKTAMQWPLLAKNGRKAARPKEKLCPTMLRWKGTKRPKGH